MYNLRACSYGPGRWDGPLGRDPAERLYIHTKTLFRSYEEASWSARWDPGTRLPRSQLPSQTDWRPTSPLFHMNSPSHLLGWKIANCACWNEFADQNKCGHLITWQNTSQRPGQIFQCERAKKFVPPGGLYHLPGLPTSIWTGPKRTSLLRILCLISIPSACCFTCTWCLVSLFTLEKKLQSIKHWVNGKLASSFVGD